MKYKEKCVSVHVLLNANIESRESTFTESKISLTLKSKPEEAENYPNILKLGKVFLTLSEQPEVTIK